MAIGRPVVSTSKANACINAKDDEHLLLADTADDFVGTITELLTYQDKKAIHNLKYFTWVEQQGKDVEELNAQWYDENYWTEFQSQIDDIDELIVDFNNEVGLI